MTIVTEALSEIIAGALSIILLTIMYSAYYEIQHSERMKNLRRFIKPSNRVLQTPKTPTSFEFSEETKFKRILSEEDQEAILRYDGRTKLFNGTCIRLDTITDSKAILSKVSFFDFMTTNLVVKPSSKKKIPMFKYVYVSLFDEDFKHAKSLKRKIKSAVLLRDKETFDDILNISELANILTVSILLEDSEGKYLIVKRGKDVAISSGVFATSCAGSLDDTDLEASNPFLACAHRELQEELNIACELTVESIVISKQKLQPAVLVCGKVDVPFQELIENIKSAQDFYEENTSLFAVPKEKVSAIVRHYQFTDVAAFQLVKNSKWGLFKTDNIKRYQIL